MGRARVAYGRPLGLSEELLRATVTAKPDDPAGRHGSRSSCGSPTSSTRRRASPRTVGGSGGHWDEGQLVELVATAGFYHLVSFVANAARVELEEHAERLPRIGSERIACGCAAVGRVALAAVLAVNTVVTDRKTEPPSADIGRT